MIILHSRTYNGDMALPDRLDLKEYCISGGRVMQTGPAAWRLELPAGSGGQYRLAQLDDYHRRARRAFPWQPPIKLSLRARASAESIPGTWGFGLWNDPFGVGFIQGGGLRLPALPNAAWFFFASPPNHLSLRDDLPAQGALAATFRSPRWPTPLFLFAAPLIPLLLLPPTMRGLRRWAQRIVRQDAVNLPVDPTAWHEFALDWSLEQVTFRLEGEVVLATAVVPAGPLGMVIWLDNQYAAIPPDGRLHYGTLPNPEPAWIEIEITAA